MSLTRHFFRELRPLFRMLEEPLGRSPVYGWPHRSMIEDPFFSFPKALRPAVDVTEQGNKYIVEVELPGVKKENVQVRIGDSGRSVTIEGKIVSGGVPANQPNVKTPGSSETSGSAIDTQGTEGPTPTTVAQALEANQISSERSFVGSSSFTRTVWLPRPADPNNVVAKLDEGILTLELPKAEDSGSVQINIQ